MSQFGKGLDNPLTYPILFLNTVIGIVVSALYKYADATTKNFATGCATALLLVIEALFGVASVRIVVIMGMLVIFLSTHLFFSHGVLSPPTPGSAVAPQSPGGTVAPAQPPADSSGYESKSLWGGMLCKVLFIVPAVILVLVVRHSLSRPSFLLGVHHHADNGTHVMPHMNASLL